MKNFISFLGTVRTGHSLVSSILDTHENIVISIEKKPLRNYMKENKSREILFKDIINSIGKDRNIGGYSYNIKNVNSKINLEFIGDSITGTKAMRLLNNNLEEFINYIGIPIFWFWIIRNPYDNIQSMHNMNKLGIEENIKLFKETIDYSENIFQKVDKCFILYIEDLIRDPELYLKNMFGFLGIVPSKGLIDLCKNKIFKDVRKVFNPNDWNEEQIKVVNNSICKDRLERYRS